MSVLQGDFLGLVADGRELDFHDGLVGGDFIPAVDVGDDAIEAVVDDHVDESQGLAVALVDDFSAQGVRLGKQALSREKKEKEK